MAYNLQLAERVREYLANIPELKVDEKKMFSGLAFLVNGKMCVNVSGDNLMCRFDPAMQQEVTVQKGYQPVVMKGKALNGYCFITPDGYKSKKDFEYWVDLCLDYNASAKASKKVKSKK